MKMAYACAAGAEHKRRKIPCQDVCGCFRLEGGALFVLADGAGSKAFARESAELAVGKTRDYFEKVPEIGSFSGPDFLNGINRTFLEAGYTAKTAGCTLEFLYTDGTSFIAGHIGDGVVIAGKGMRMEPLLLPENGDVVNRTFLLPSEDAGSHFRILRGSLQKYDIFIFSSDGSADLLYNVDNLETAPACRKIAEWAEAYSEEELGEILQDNLEHVLADKTHDDISIGVVYADARKREEEKQEYGAHL